MGRLECGTEEGRAPSVWLGGLECRTEGRDISVVGGLECQTEVKGISAWGSLTVESTNI